ncbi:putative secondary metabolism biosynthetic enzyme [Arthroderma sp. PD_2]|nr:putative secondary metabolism biosynthetic enzyme [Arthroderma sp. PD_2]
MASPEKILFTLPIRATNGSVTVTEPAEKTYLLTFSSPPDNRLVTDFCQAFLLALDIIETRYPHGVVITTSGITKFYSNGLDLDHAFSVPGYHVNSLYKLFARLASYPMPTVAWLNGHAFAGGLMLAMHHDYRVFNPSRGYLCLNELDFGAPLKPAMLGIFEAKVSPVTYRSLILEAKRFTAREALASELVDKLGAWEEVLQLVEERKLTMRAKSGAYGILKEEMYRSVIANLEGHEERVKKDAADEWKAGKIKQQREQRVAAWEETQGKARL